MGDKKYHKSKKSYYLTLFFIFTLFYAVETKWTFLASILVIVASILKLTEVIPRLIRAYKAFRADRK